MFVSVTGLSVSAPWNDIVYVFKPIPFITVIVDASWPNPQVLRCLRHQQYWGDTDQQKVVACVTPQVL